MADNKIKVRHVQRHDTESNWSSKDPVLLDGELAFTTDGTNTGKYKLGNGTSKWSTLSYAKARLEKDDVTTALGYTPSATNHTHNYAGSSSAGGVATSANKLATARSIALGTGASGSTTFDGSMDVTIPVTSIKESYLSWGGRNISGSYSCIDAAMIPDLGANRLAFGKAAGITVEYSRDRGSTWIDYDLSDYNKVSLFGNGGDVAIGKSDSTDKATATYMLRITIDTDAFGVYTVLNKFAIYISTSGSTGTYCSIDASLESTPTTWVNFADKVSISGWSGWNIINTSSLMTYGNSKTVQYGLIRFTFGCTGGSTTYTGLRVHRIMGFGGVGWTTPSNMAKYGTIYTYDNNQNVAFPAKVTATSFSGNASTATALTTSAGSTTQPVYFSNGKPVATTYTLGKSVPSDAVFTDTKYTLPTASSSTLGGVKTTSTVTSTSGYTACPIISGIPYYKNTTYSVASTSSNGLMSSSDKKKLNGMTLMSVTDFEALFK